MTGFWGFGVSAAIEKNYNPVVNQQNFEKLRDLRNVDCMLVTEPHLMRGVDYRYKGEGIDLLLARDFNTTRAFIQGCGRVGRYSEPCDRFQLDTMAEGLINEKEELRLRGAIG